MYAANLTASARTHGHVAAPDSLQKSDMALWVAVVAARMDPGAMKSDELTEYALRRGDCTMDIRGPGGTEHLYPAEQWTRDQQALSARAFRRRMLVIEDRVEVPISDLRMGS